MVVTYLGIDNRDVVLTDLAYDAEANVVAISSVLLVLKMRRK